MHRKYLLHFFLFSNIAIFLNFVQGEIDYKSIMTSEEFLNCDYIGLGSKLEALRTGNEHLKLEFLLMKHQLDSQQGRWQDLDRKLDKIALNLQTNENKILKENKDNFNKVKDLTLQQYQTILSRFPAPGGDGQWELLIDIKETLKTHYNLFETFGGKLKNIENLLNKSNEENQTRELGNSISKNFLILQNIDKKLSGIENVTATQETQMIINQNQARELGSSISKNFGVLQNIDKKITGIENVTATQKTQMEISRNLQKYLNKTESIKTCFEGEKQNLICNVGTYPSDCANYKETFCSNTTCRIYNYLFGADPFLVSCDNKTEDGGWTVIQRRMNGSVDFYRDWSEYKTGFGDINGEFFIGLDKLNALTTSLKPVELFIRLEKFDGRIEIAKYDEFEVGNELEKFKLKKLGKHSGNSTDCLAKHRSYNFSTKDRQNDINHDSCAQFFHGAWWYYNCITSNLNGRYYKTSDTGGKLDGITWCNREGYNYSLKSTQMSIRPIRL